MASVGMLAGLGQTLLAFVAASLSFLVLFTLGRLERVLFRKHEKTYEHVALTLLLQPDKADTVRQWIDKSLKHPRFLSTQQSLLENSDLLHMAYTLDTRGLNLDWKVWRKKLDQQEGVVSSGLKLNQTLPAPKSH